MKNRIIENIVKRINIYATNNYFALSNSKWYLVQKIDEENDISEMTENDCDLEILNSGEDGSEVYGFAVFGY